MPYSMTAFARIEFNNEWGRGSWELRSVNHRYAEVSVRAPEDYRNLETTIRDRLGKALKRGKIDCNLKFEPRGGDSAALQINEAAAREVLAAADRIVALASDPATRLAALDPLDILRWPGVTTVTETNINAVTATMLAALDDALAEFLATRQREGEKMAAVIQDRLGGIRVQLDVLATRVPEIISSIRERHAARLQEIAPELDAGRLEQECALLAQRLDVAEELDRLAAHLDEVTRVLAQNEPIGRRLDFLMQELNREANTLGSKSAHIDTAGAAVELKVLIEQIREQVQNLE